MKQNKNTEGSVYKRKDGRWSFAYYDQNHKRHVKYAKTQKEAKQIQKEWQEKHKEQCNVSYLPLEDYILNYLREFKKNEIKITTYNSYLTFYKKYISGKSIGKTDITEVASEDLQRLYNQMTEAGYNAKTVRHVSTIINIALEHAVKTRIIRENPNKFTVLPKKKKFQAGTLSKDEIRRIVKDAKEDPLYPVVIFTLATGMRKGEVMGLQWECIDWEQKCVYVNKALCCVVEDEDEKGHRKSHYELLEPKNESSVRTIPLNSIAMEALQIQKKRQEREKETYAPIYADNHLVFAREDGMCMGQRDFLDRYYAFLERYGAHKIRFHDLRHSYASLLIMEANIPAKVVQDLLGHSQISTTLDIYAHTSNIAKYSATDKLDELFKDENRSEEDE